MDEAKVVERLNTVGVTALSDALDRLEIAGQLIGLAPVARGMKFSGRAFTIRMLPVGLTGGSVGDYIDEVPPGAVVAIDNGGILNQTVWGDILTYVAHTKGIAATIATGLITDSATVFPVVFAISVCPDKSSPGP